MARSVEAMVEACDGDVSSDARRRPKKADVTAAQSMVASARGNTRKMRAWIASR